MDALALLCTLHADGPTALHRLRRAGCTSLAEVDAAPLAALTEALGASDAVARRFQREARQLLARVAEEGESKRAQIGTTSRTSAADPRASKLSAKKSSASKPSAKKPSARAAQPIVGAVDSRADAAKSSADPLADVLDRWRTLDRETASARPAAANRGDAARPSAVRHEPAALRAHDVQGLDDASCTRLAQAGVRTLAQLARVDALTVARASGLAYTSVTRWSALARRALTASPAVEPRSTRTATRTSSASPDAAPAHSSERAGGPFAD